MKHVFIINPAAGPKNSFDTIKAMVEKHTEIDYVIYKTQGEGDATIYVKKMCEDNPEEQLRFYACGGDGTMNEVLNGVVGHENAALTVYPSGSGNDYVKYFGGARLFLDLDSVIKGTEVPVDVMKINNRYALNVINFGFDTVVVKTMMKVKRLPLMKGKMSYIAGVISGLFGGRHNNCYIKADGELLNPDGEFMMCTMANGSFVGGSFNCAPRSIVNDGLIEVTVVKPVELIKVPDFIGKYTNGTFIDDPACQKYVTYRQARKIELDWDKPYDMCIDGELDLDSHFTIENLEGAVRFVVPAEDCEC
ncbi:MAG: YegS/Rv2252/BmrU family lipid kinase [Erysipelotrichaceae bacterium]|nr:YegS/Rv2252/BmrU family lipid kinase [Erysipelotrichaceae bacterium]